MVLPELSICASGEEAFLTVNAVVAPGEDPAAAVAALEARLAGLRDEPLPLIDPHPTARAGDPQRPAAGGLRAGRRRGDRADRRAAS